MGARGCRGFGIGARAGWADGKLVAHTVDCDGAAEGLADVGEPVADLGVGGSECEAGDAGFGGMAVRR